MTFNNDLKRETEKELLHLTEKLGSMDPTTDDYRKVAISRELISRRYNELVKIETDYEVKTDEIVTSAETEVETATINAKSLTKKARTEIAIQVIGMVVGATFTGVMLAYEVKGNVVTLDCLKKLFPKWVGKIVK